MSGHHTAPIASVPPPQPTASATPNQRAADGDYLAPGPGRATVKDADGDYKPSPAQTSTSAVQAALTDIKLGG